MPNTPGDRRPIASRNLPIWQRTAAALARAHVSANAISIAGMFAGLAAGTALFFTNCHGDICPGITSTRIHFLLAAALIQLRLLANMLDGMVAIASNKASPLGELFNEIPDRVSDTAILVGAGYALGSNPLLGWAAAAVALFVTYIRALGKGAGVPGLFQGPMAKSHRMFLLTLTCILNAAVPIVWQYAFSSTQRPLVFGPMAIALALIIAGGLLTAYRRLKILVRTLRERPPMIDPAATDRLFNPAHAFDHPVVRILILGLLCILVATPLLILLLSTFGKPSDKLKKDLWDRYWSWLLFIPMMFGPVLLGAAWVIAGVGLLSLLCYREFARATGLFREPLISAVVVLGILVLTAAVADHWYNFFTALTPLTIAIMAAAAILADRPKGYIQRLALGILAFLLFGVCFGHLGYFANAAQFRPLLLWLISAVELNDIFAYISGKSFGHRKLAPNTSPNKTLGGALGALALTTTFAALLGHYVFAGTRVDHPLHLLALGLIISAAGQFGDLTLSSVKRDLGIKDWANTFPGHGGLLDRFNSLLFAAPAVFHYVGYLKGIGLEEPKRIFF